MSQLNTMNVLAVNGGRVTAEADKAHFALSPTTTGYADAQLHDYTSRRDFCWRPPVSLALRARFSAATLTGTAGFGFWNAPAGDPTVRRPTLPRAVWFFYASPPNDLPFLSGQTGWFASVIDAATPLMLPLLPLGFPFLLLNQFSKAQKYTRPLINRCLKIKHAVVPVDPADWHDYRIAWRLDEVQFSVDGRPVLTTPFAPSGRLGFVSWIDNQWMRATIDGRFGAGTLPITAPQAMTIRDFSLTGESDHRIGRARRKNVILIV